MDVNQLENSTEPLCWNCNSVIQKTDSFCGTCGKPIQAEEESADKEDIFERIRPTLLFYFANLILLAIYKLTSVFEEGFDGLILISIIDTLMIIGFWSYYAKSLSPFLSLKKIKLHVVIVTIIVAVVSAFVVNTIANIINLSLFDDVSYQSEFTDNLSHPFLWAILITCIQPALFEEVTFRGFIYNNIDAVTTNTSTILITSFMFGFMHLSFIGLLWLVPLGLAAAWLRAQYNTLWYGIIAHFFYNFTITVIEFYL